MSDYPENTNAPDYKTRLFTEADRLANAEHIHPAVMDSLRQKEEAKNLTIVSDCILHVRAETNYSPGLHRNSVITTICFRDDAGTNMHVNVSQSEGIKLVFTGHSECECLIDALEFAARTLRQQAKALRLNHESES